MEVLNSISMAFSKEEGEEKLPSTIDSAGQGAREGDMLDQISALFQANIAGVEVKKNRLGNTLYMRMGLKEFDQQFSEDNEEFGGKLAPVLASLLAAEEVFPYTMEIVVNMKTNPAQVQNENPEAIKDKIKSTSRYAELIEAAGLSAKYLSVGLGQGDQDTVDLYFKRYQPFNPLGKNGKVQN